MIEYEHQQKGLFTFYRQQAAQEQSIIKPNKIKKKKKNQNLDKIRHHLNNKVIKNKHYQQTNYFSEEKMAPLKIYEFLDHSKVLNSQTSQKKQTTNLKISNQKLSPLSKLNASKNNYLPSQIYPNRINKQPKRQGLYLINKQFPYISQNNRYQISKYHSQVLCRGISQRIVSINSTKNQQKELILNRISKVKSITMNSHKSDNNSDYRNSLEQNKRNSLQWSNLPLIQNGIKKTYIIPKRYKSRRIQLALKSGDSVIIKKIRQSLKNEQNNRNYQNISYINMSSECQQGNKNENYSKLRGYQLNSILQKLHKEY